MLADFVSYNMSNRLQNEKRNRPSLPANSARQEWVPRGSITTTILNPPSNSNASSSKYGGDSNNSSTQSDRRSRRSHASQTFQNQLPSFNSNPNGNIGNSNSISTQSESQNKRNDSSISRVNRPANYRREREKCGNQVASGFVEKSAKQERTGYKNSNLPQLVQEIQEKLIKGTVECMICYDMVRRSAPIWSCSSCYSIFHLNCIKKWARAPTSIDLSAEKNQGFNWRCPGCQSVQLTSSKEIRYVCFCGKRTDPYTDLYLTPHSCGEPCGKPLAKDDLGFGDNKEDHCPHVCVLQCHPGPCPSCKTFAAPRLCPCGKKTITTRCSDRKSALTCGQHCDKLLNCGRHRCEQVCHVGPCDPCQISIDASCFCKKKFEVVVCGDMIVKGVIKIEDGIFSCDSICGKELGCGNHFCTEVCHPGPCGECGLMPGRLRTCHCGKTRLQEERHSCLDPIPTCSQICSKLLRCGLHYCKEVCHTGDCPPCFVEVLQKCRCQSTSRTVECYKATQDKFTCDRPCGQKKNCGRHRCSERCCPLSNSSISPSEGWDLHLCSMPCGKRLQCGQHSCGSLCHSGHCPPCLETIFTDLTCACGRTSIPPPLPCGIPPPSCQLPCSVPQPCGHSSSHSCHFGDCPPCSVPVPKECVGGHVVLSNIPCGSRDIRCNKLCGKTRQCGMHACGRVCHLSPCDNSPASEPGAKSSCGQICGAPRRDCQHTCTAHCHPSTPCPDVRCEFPVKISCSCGRITATVPCGAGGNSFNFNADTIKEALVIQKLPVSLQPVEASAKKIPLRQRKLTCDEECAKLERKRVLAEAFDVSSPNLDSLHFGENSVVSGLLSDLYRRDPKWVLSVEERCKYLVLCKRRGTMEGLKVHVFCPMLKDKRDAVRVIADRWKLAVNAAGWEPKRFIVVHVTPKSKVPPRVIGVKGSGTVNPLHPPVFDPLVDMDPRLVVSFPDLPREADISALVLRFGGECELVWLNDRNALAVFHDPARAATAMRRLDHGSIYHGAVILVNPTAGGSLASSGMNAWSGSGINKGNPWKKAVVQDSGWKDDAWDDRELSVGSVNPCQSLPKKEAPLTASPNRWNLLDHETGPSSSLSARSQVSGEVAGAGSSSVGGTTITGAEIFDVVDDWEKAYDNAL